MATFTCSIRATGTTTARVTASLKDAGAFARRRWVYIELNYDDTRYILGVSSDAGVNTTFSGTLSGLQPGRTYRWTAEIAYEQPAGAVPPNVPISPDFLEWGEFTTREETYDIYATIVYDPNGGTGGPGSQTIHDEITSSGGANIPFTIPTSIPTRSGYVFAGWLFPSGYVLQPGASAVLWGTENNPTYTATAQWTAQGVRIFIDNGSSWDEYKASIGNGSGWDAVTPSIDNGTNWG